VHFASWLYAALMLAIAVGEFPLNMIVFQLFGEREMLTQLMAGTLGLVLPAAAHFLGLLLRQGWLRAGRLSAHPVFIALLVVVPMGVLVGIAYVREKFFEALKPQELFGITVDYQMVTVIFLAINVLIFLLATVAAYVRHDEEAAQCHRRVWAATARGRQARSEVATVSQLLEARRTRCQQLYNERIRTFDRMKHEAKEWKDITQKLMEVYRRYNLRQRADTTLPKSFEQYPPIAMLTDDITLEWACGPPTVDANREKVGASGVSGI